MNRVGVPSWAVVVWSMTLLGASCEDSSVGLLPAMLRVAHFAPEVPGIADTELDFTILDQGSFERIAFARASDYATLDPDLYFVDVTPVGVAGAPLAMVAPRVDVNLQYTLVAYRDVDETSGLSVLVAQEDPRGPLFDGGSVVVVHGADDDVWRTVSVVDADTEDVLVTDLAFGSQSAPFDLAAGMYNLRFDGVAPSAMIDQGPVQVRVEPNETLLLVLIDTDVTAGVVDAAVYSLGPST
ncbi:MAG: DUF4397 domain-containing protein, partial [Polyangiales bacterium]